MGVAHPLLVTFFRLKGHLVFNFFLSNLFLNISVFIINLLCNRKKKSKYLNFNETCNVLIFFLLFNI